MTYSTTPQMASLVFSHVKERIFSGQINPELDTFYVRLVRVPPASTDITVSQMVEMSGGNYAPVNLLNKTISTVGSNAIIDFDDPVWANLTVAAGQSVTGMVLCRYTAPGTPSNTDWVITYNEMASPYSPNGSTLTVTLPADGVLRLV